jgi:hypothetical protein
MPVTRFLTALAANPLTSRVLPGDVLDRPSHRFALVPRSVIDAGWVRVIRRSVLAVVIKAGAS